MLRKSKNGGGGAAGSLNPRRLNRVDPDHYQGWDGRLVACEFDANDMTALAAGSGFQTKTLLTEAATAKALIDAIEKAAATLESGDVLLLTYSGHGGQVPDSNGDEDDRMDETWVLYDRQVVDDELYALWAKFKPGVRIAIFSDSCHSGTVGRELVIAVGEERVTKPLGAENESAPRIKGMPDPVIRSVYEHHKDLYDGIQRALPPFDETDVGASVLLTSGCQDNQTSLDGDKNGSSPRRCCRCGTTASSAADTGLFTSGSPRRCRPGRARTCSRWERGTPSSLASIRSRSEEPGRCRENGWAM